MKVLKNLSNRIPALLFGLLFVTCHAAAADSQKNFEIPAEVARIPVALKEQPPFVCTFESARIPKRDPDAHNLFLHATRLYKKNIRTDEYKETFRLYRIAAAWGHDKAARHLAHLLISNYRAAEDSPVKPIDIAEELIRNGMPGGYLLMSRLLEEGHGVKKDSKVSLQFLRFAADQGDPHAQFILGEKFYSLSLRYPFLDEIGLEMQRCAADQGHTQAAYDIAERFQSEEKYSEALRYYQIAVQAKSNAEGHYLYSRLSAEQYAASELQRAFNDPDSDSSSYLGLVADKIRAARYNKINGIFKNDDYPIPPEGIINQIVPLPPAKLSAWDGKIEIVPPLPSEKRIREMARAKGLDPQTGLPVKK